MNIFISLHFCHEDNIPDPLFYWEKSHDFKYALFSHYVGEFQTNGKNQKEYCNEH